MGDNIDQFRSVMATGGDADTKTDDELVLETESLQPMSRRGLRTERVRIEIDGWREH